MEILSASTPNVSFELVPDNLREMLDHIQLAKDHVNVISFSHVISDFLPEGKCSRFWSLLSKEIKAAQSSAVLLIMDRFELHERLSDCIPWYSFPGLEAIPKTMLASLTSKFRSVW
eukprot:TRINITY_DN90660_c0_g1_i1.p2 TRINITY_DN90660_c0_g1~~TRINITY_DN90660_c0_g1_i1.p2  ORF type:complete len:116 (-),score=17.99 TRINITY_DN90660_c0_g1_i1:439-786(-)